MLVLESVAIYGSPEQVVENPPDIVMELFDWDHVVRRYTRRKIAQVLDLRASCNKCYQADQDVFALLVPSCWGQEAVNNLLRADDNKLVGTNL